MPARKLDRSASMSDLRRELIWSHAACQGDPIALAQAPAALIPFVLSDDAPLLGDRHFFRFGALRQFDRQNPLPGTLEANQLWFAFALTFPLGASRAEIGSARPRASASTLNWLYRGADRGRMRYNRNCLLRPSNRVAHFRCVVAPRQVKYSRTLLPVVWS